MLTQALYKLDEYFYIPFQPNYSSLQTGQASDRI